MVKGFRSTQEKFVIPTDCYNHCNAAIQAIQMDLSDLFFLDLNHISTSTDGSVAHCLPSFLDPPQICRQKRQAILQIGQQIVSKTNGMSTLDKELYIVDYLTTNTKYCKMTGANEPRSYTVEGVFLEHKAVCMGYSRAFNFLARMAGIPSMLAEGVIIAKPDEGHCWNIAEIDGHSYQLDVTNSFVQGSFVSRTLINLSDKRAALYARLSGKYPLPACPSSFLLMPVAHSADELMQHLRAGARGGQEAFQIAMTHRFASSQQLEELIRKKLKLSDHGWYNRISSYIYESELSVLTMIMK